MLGIEIASTAMSKPEVKLAQGNLLGTTLHGNFPRAVEAFRGIPYALPPTGERRFRPPEKVAPSQDTIDASDFGPRAPAKQLMTIGPKLEESEDCLTVNIFRQAEQNGATALPVAVYLHAGAFNRGNAAMHDTASMVGWSELPFIGVSFGYRIGALGFLPSRLSAAEGALNLGLKDQICLFDWIEENIEHFGGDKNNVTLIGLSAGAHSVRRNPVPALYSSTDIPLDRPPPFELRGRYQAQISPRYHRVRRPHVSRSSQP
jgi:carboxylesterase type B